MLAAKQVKGPHRILVICAASTHIRSICAKLQVRDPSSAVQHARELRLLAAGRTR
jgi:hypothetical protein